jgi:hypothetical protein
MSIESVLPGIVSDEMAALGAMWQYRLYRQLDRLMDHRE